jgi:hypothetical protein
MSLKRIFLSLTFSTLCVLSMAQISVPSMDFQLKAGVAALLESQDSYENQYTYIAPSLYAEINWNITQHISIGAFGSAGVYSTSNYKVKYSTGDASYGGTHSLYGLKLRLSTGRAPRFRPFGEINYGKMEMVMEKDIYRVASSTTFFGWSMGLMIRAGSRFYIILPQVNLRFRSNGFFFEDPSDYMFGSYEPFAEVCGGLSYNIGKKK